MMRLSFALFAGATLAGCVAAPPGPRGLPCSEAPVVSSVVRSMRFARSERGVSDGFDIDGEVSHRGSPTGCGQADFMREDGTPGIDNQIATLVPLIEGALSGNSLDAILQTAIDDGQLLLAIELLGVDDPMNDDCVTLRTRPLMGTPILDTNGSIDGYQTLDAQPDGEQTVIANARIVDGVVDVGPAQLIVPVQILDAHFTLHVQSGFMHIEMNEDGSWSGRLGGGISAAEMTTIAMGLNIPSDLMATVASLLASTADLAPDPTTHHCTQVSATLDFESVPAFVLE
jgi:hypothetical protein